MICKDYFISSQFEDVWHTLQTYYNEPEGVMNLYKTLFYTIRNLPVDEAHSSTPMTVISDFEGKIHISGTPDPIEWLVGREVVLENAGEPSDSKLAAHLLYWSTLYDFKTQTRHHKDFSNISIHWETAQLAIPWKTPIKHLAAGAKSAIIGKKQ